MKSTGNFRCCVGLVLLHNSGCQLSVLSLTWLGKLCPFSGFSRKTYCSSVLRLSPVMSGFVGVTCSIRDLPENVFVLEESKVMFWYGCRVWALHFLCHKFSFSKGTPVSLETTNSLLDLLCFYGDGEPTPQKEQEEKEGLEDPEVWETCWSLLIYIYL